MKNSPGSTGTVNKEPVGEEGKTRTSKYALELFQGSKTRLPRKLGKDGSEPFEDAGSEDREAPVAGPGTGHVVLNKERVCDP